MSKKVEDWIKKRVGICIHFDSDSAAQKLYSGYIFYQLLLSYNILNKECLDEPKKECSSSQALWNLVSLLPWFKLSGVIVTPQYLYDVSQKDVKKAIKLLLMLYSKLEDNNSVHLLTKQMKYQKLTNMRGRFDISKSTEPVIEPIPENPDQNLEWPLIKNKDLIEIYKRKKAKFDAEFKEQVRLRKLKIAEKNEPLSLSLPKAPRRYEPRRREDMTDPIKAFVDICEDRNISEELYLNCTPRQHVQFLKKKKENFLANDLLKQKMHNMLVHDMWVEMMEKKYRDFNTFFENRLFQQSEPEKKLLLRFARTHNNYKSFFEHQQIVKDVPEIYDGHKKKEDAIRKKENEEKLEKDRILELYKRFENKKETAKNIFAQETCRDIVKDLADLAVFIAEHKKETGDEPSKDAMEDAKALFYKGVPFHVENPPEYFVEEEHEEIPFENYESVFELDNLSYNQKRNIEDNMLRDQIAHEILKNYYVDCYIHNKGRWNWDNYPELVGLREKLVIHSHDIYRLLEFKYSFPDAPLMPNFSHFKIRALLRHFYNQEFLECLKMLLEPTVAVFGLNDALNYCLMKYEEEKSITPFAQSLKFDEIGEEAEEEEEFAVPEEVKAVGMGEKAKYFGKKLVYHKAVQVPDEDELERRLRHSAPALLGKIAFETLNKGEPLDEALGAKMIIEYLKTLEHYDGFVLVDYPNSISQAALLEYLITGTPVQVNFPMEYDEKETIFQNMEPPMAVDTRLLVDFEHKFKRFITEKSFAAKEKIIPMFPKLILTPKEPKEGAEEIVYEPKEPKRSSPKRRRSSAKRRRSSGMKRRRSSKRGSTLSRSKDKNKKTDINLDDYIQTPIAIDKEPISEEEPSNISLKDLMLLRKSKILPHPNKFIHPSEYYQDGFFQNCITNILDKTGKIVTRRRRSSAFQELAKDKVLEESFSEVAKSVISLEMFDESPEVQNKIQKVSSATLETLPSPLIFYKYFNIPISFFEVHGNVPVKTVARIILNEPERLEDPLRRNSADLFGQNLESCVQNELTRSKTDIDVTIKNIHETPDDMEKNKNKELDEEQIRENALDPLETFYKAKEEVEEEMEEAEEEMEKEVKKGDKSKRKGSVKRRFSKGRKGSSKSIRRQSKRRQSRRQSRKSVRRSSKKSIRRASRKSVRRKSSRKSIRRKSTKGTKDKKTAKSPPKEDSSPPVIVKYFGPKPGDPGWIYMLEPIPDKLQIALASLWEVMEHVYLRNLRSALDLVRKEEEMLTPVKKNVHGILTNFLDQPDERLNIVSNFQIMFNEVNDAIRSEPVVKAELHYRVHELKETLTNLAVEKATVAKSDVENVVEDKLGSYYAYPLINAYVNIMQLELDRYADTLLIFNDYYLSMLKAKLNESRVEKITLEKLVVPQKEDKVDVHEAESELSVRKKSRKKKGRGSKQGKADEEGRPRSKSKSLAGSDFVDWNKAVDFSLFEAAGKARGTHDKIQEMIKDEKLGSELRAELESKKEKEKEKAEKSSKGRRKSTKGRRQSSKSIRRGSRRQSRRRSSQRRQSGRRRSSQRRQSGRRKSSQRRQSRKSSQGGRRQSRRRSSKRKQASESARRRARMLSTSQSKSSLNIMDAEIRESDLVDLIKMEWSAAVQNEFQRLLLRLKLIESKMKEDINEILQYKQDAVQKKPEDVQNRLENEIKAIDDLCLVLKAAIEDETAIQPLLILDKDKFYIDRSNLLFPDKDPFGPEPLEETKSDMLFTIKQLDNLLTKLNFISPNGIVQEAFINLLEEMAQNTTELQHPFLPSKWSKLERDDFQEMVRSLFGFSGIINWKDFILLNLGIPWPDLEDLIELKTKFEEIDEDKNETVTKEQYLDIPLWFDKDFGETIYDDLRYALAKDLLFKMFQAEDDMNYTEFLLAFCKNDDINEGFLNALTLLGSEKLVRDVPCYQVRPYQNIEAEVVIDQLMTKFSDRLDKKIDDIEVKTLPTHYPEEIFNSAQDEYMVGEKILALNNVLKPASVDEGLKKKDDRELSFKRETLYNTIYLDPRWQICVPYKLALTLMMAGSKAYGTSPDHLHRILDLEERLQDLFATKGKDGYIKGFNLGESDLYKEYFEYYPTYKWSDVNKILRQIFQRKEYEAKVAEEKKPEAENQPQAT